MKKILLLSSAFFLALPTLLSAQDDWNTIDASKAVSIDTIVKKPYTLVFVNMSPSFDTAIKTRLTDAFFEVYPKEAKTYNPKTLKKVVFIVDPGYDGIAATSGEIVRYNPEWFVKHPGDIDIVTHEAMHIIQSYPGESGPGWITEGIADYVRYDLGVDNKGAGWALPDIKADHNYDNAYRITARFFVWLEANKKKGLVKKLDAAMRTATYTDGFWKTNTGKTVDELWAEYIKNPSVKLSYRQAAVNVSVPAKASEPAAANAAQKSLLALQQQFVDLGFGMFIHYNIPTYMNDDWADPQASPALFNPKKLDADQWAKAAKSANMTYGCLTTKHHSGFAIWDTKTTDYNVMNSPLKRDVVKEYVDAFRANKLDVMLYFSILDTHHDLRPGHITPEHIKMVKAQLTELLTNYGEIKALIIDGWDAPWSRISYDDIPFEEIYSLIKALQPNCLVMDLNAAKYPSEALFYTDIKSYEQGAGQHISKETNKLPALSCLPLQRNWFWKESFPTTPVKDAAKMVNDNLIPFNQAYCNFILNVAPNRDGLIDDNALAALKQIGQLYKRPASFPKLPTADLPIISSNIAKHKPANGSWSDDMNIMDFAVDDDFGSAWSSNPSVKNPWFEVELGKDQRFNMVTIVENRPNISKYRLEYLSNGVWKPLVAGTNTERIKIHRFESVWGARVRMLVDASDSSPAIMEFGVYNERR